MQVPNLQNGESQDSCASSYKQSELYKHSVKPEELCEEYRLTYYLFVCVLILLL